MATPTLKKVLQHVSAEKIDCFNELIPGIPADKKNLSTLLKYIKKSYGYYMDAGKDGPRCEFNMGKRGKKQELGVALEGPEEKWRCGPNGMHSLCTRPCLAVHIVECTEDGLLEASSSPRVR